MDAGAAFDVRAALADDVAPSAALAVAHSGRDLETWIAKLERVRVDEDAALFVAIADAKVVAYGKLEWHDFTGDPGCRNVEPGWHLAGIVVDPAQRERGIGSALTRARIEWLRARDPSASLWYCTNARNVASLALHRSFGFEEVTRDFAMPRLTFDGGEGVLCRLALH
jgi:ribosomal protein S18 acetylase RimI-like enzyme